MFKQLYPKVWPFIFVLGGILSVMSGMGHQGDAAMGGMAHGAAAGAGVFSVFGASVGLHDLMWFLMALAHLDALWGNH